MGDNFISMVSILLEYRSYRMTVGALTGAVRCLLKGGSEHLWIKFHLKIRPYAVLVYSKDAINLIWFIKQTLKLFYLTENPPLSYFTLPKIGYMAGLRIVTKFHRILIIIIISSSSKMCVCYQPRTVKIDSPKIQLKVERSYSHL